MAQQNPRGHGDGAIEGNNKLKKFRKCPKKSSGESGGNGERRRREEESRHYPILKKKVQFEETQEKGAGAL